jgi:tetratricopeptide (TPR) repeat protein
MTEDREFVDELNHPSMEEYYELVQSYDGRETTSFLNILQNLIEEDPYFLDPYLAQSEVFEATKEYKKSKKIIDIAYEKAVHIITDSKGNWPDKLQWIVLENRHIIRALCAKAVSLWRYDQKKEALILCQRTLRMNPNDNCGIRYYILAIRMRMSYRDFIQRFDQGGYYNDDVIQWFDKYHSKFPDVLV